MPERKPWEEESFEEEPKGKFGQYGLRRDAPGGAFYGPPLADRVHRLLARIIDGVLDAMALLPGFACAIVGLIMYVDERNRSPAGLPLLLGGIGLIVCCYGSLLIYQIVSLTRRGQTIGKRFMKVRVVMYEDGSPADFVHAWVLRNFVPYLIGMVGGVVWNLVDTLFIFGEEQRCVHDLIASTKVVEAWDGEFSSVQSGSFE